MKTYRMIYWYHASEVFDINAESEEDAEEQLKRMVESGEVDINTFDIGDDGIEFQGTVED